MSLVLTIPNFHGFPWKYSFCGLNFYGLKAVKIRPIPLVIIPNLVLIIIKKCLNRWQKKFWQI